MTVTPASPPAPHTSGPWLALTPAGALFAFSQAQPTPEQAGLQTVLAAHRLPAAAAWAAGHSGRSALQAHALAQGWLQEVGRGLRAPDIRLADFLPHVISGLSGERQAALSSSGGFCVAHTGCGRGEAEALCAAAADFSAFVRRQRARGWQGASGLASFHNDVLMLIPSVSFVPFWVDGVDYCLVLGGEPLTNNIALVELIWSIKSAAFRFTAQE